MPCDRCTRTVRRDETSYRVSLGYNLQKPFWREGYRYRSAGYICQVCKDEVFGSSFPGEYRDPIPCSICERPVAFTRARGVPKIVVCCNDCRYVAYLARKRRKPVARACETCGATFSPKRYDARFCSNHCRQRAFRRRAA